MSEEPPQNGSELHDPLELVDALLAEVQAIRGQWKELDALLAQMERSEPAGSTGTAGDVTAEDPARLMALELARAGRSREEVEGYLQQTFGLRADPALLDAVFADPSL